MGKYILDGQVYVHRKTGIYRYCNEILKELDKIVPSGTIDILVPENAVLEPIFSNINIIRFGKGNGVIWAQTYLPLYCIKHHLIPVSFYNTTPIIRPGIVVIHDVAYKALSKNFKNIYGKMSCIWHRFQYWYISKQKYQIITVSEFSKNEICKYYKVDPDRIEIIGNGWQHYQLINEDDSIFKEYDDIIPNNYYFSMGSLEDRKNFKWVLKTAKNNPNDMFVIVGKIVKNATYKIEEHLLSNVKMLGYVDDGKAKALMRNAKAFLFPSIYEGFGIPPLEALSVGTKVVCSNASCLPEICKDAVFYINPYDYDIDINKILELKTGNATKVLEAYSWEKSAYMMKDLLL